MRGPKSIIAAAFCLYVLAMVVAWSASLSMASRKTRETLSSSRDMFVKISEDAVDSVLWYSSCLAFDILSKESDRPTTERMQQIARQLHLDEMNLISSNGIIVASNFRDQVGIDIKANPLSAEYMRILRPGSPYYSYGQPYRQSLTDPTRYYKYYGVAFPDRSRMVQLGLSLQHIADAFSHTPVDDYNKWRIGRYGHYEAVDRDTDGHVDAIGAWPKGMPEEGVFGEENIDCDGHVFTYTFPYAGLLFRAVIPAREFYEQRNLFLTVGGTSLGLILAFLTFFLVKLSVSAQKLEAMHRAAEERNAADLALAHVVQQSALPHANLFRRTQLDSVFEAVSYPAREVGGDFYGFFELTNGKVVFLVADVSGKGIPAAMFMHIASNAIRAGFYIFEDVCEAVSQVNDYLIEHNEAEMFVTAWIGILDPTTGEVEYVNAGHNRPYVVRADDRIDRIDGKGGLFLGMFKGATYRSHRLRLGRGDRLFLYTDGVTEAMDCRRSVYGAERLERLLARTHGSLCQAVKGDVDAHVGKAERSDDLTMLTLAWHGEPSRAERTLPADESSLAEAMSFLRAEMALADKKQRSRLCNAVDELVANVISYSGVRDFTVTVENVPGRCRVTLSDNGQPFNPLAHVDPETHQSLDEHQIGGLGILMAKRLVDFAIYRRDGDRNVVTLVQNG